MKFIQIEKIKKSALVLLFIFTSIITSSPPVTVFADLTEPAKKEVTKAEEKVVKATTNIDDKTLQQLVVDTVKLASKYVLRILLALTVLVFLYGLMKYMFKGQESDTARSEGRKMMLWGIIGLFVITSIWGLVTIAASLLGHTQIVVPQFK